MSSSADDVGKRWVDALLLCSLPLLLLVVDSRWIFSGLSRDYWIYYGYFRNGIYYAREFSDLYYSSRLSVIVPGFVVHHLLPALPANIVLHLGVYFLAVGSYYGTVAAVFGRSTARLGTVCFGMYPLFLAAVGSNYVDGFAIAYFLAALHGVVRACHGRAPAIALATAGAFAAALVTASLLFALYVPFLVAAFVYLNARGARLSAGRSALAAGVGAATLILAFTGLNRAAGGPWNYLASSLDFVAGTFTGRIANDWRALDAAWLRDAIWLVFPAVALLGAVVLLARRHSLLQPSASVATQLQLVLCAAGMIVLQFSGMNLLEHSNAASMLTPFAFLAFAGQLRQVTGPGESGATAWPIAIAVVVGVLPWALHFTAADAFAWRSSPAAVPLLVGAFAAGLLAIGARGTGATLLFLAAVGLAQGMLVGPAAVQMLRGSGREEFLQMSGAVEAVESSDPSLTARLWFDWHGEHGEVFDCVASAYLLCPRLLFQDFPELASTRMCDGSALGPGQVVAILSTHADAFGAAVRTLAHHGLAAQLVTSVAIPGPIAGFTVTTLRTLAPQDGAVSSRSGSEDAAMRRPGASAAQ